MTSRPVGKTINRPCSDHRADSSIDLEHIESSLNFERVDRLGSSLESQSPSESLFRVVSTVGANTGPSLHTFIASIFEHMTTARAEKKEIQCTMPQNVGLPSPGISKLLKLQWLEKHSHDNLSRTRLPILMRSYVMNSADFVNMRPQA
ncbi:hypothetical protein AVEN_148969-1 [Araneus ventricosus]|uniref:Uncharacterized protein n=1 Tax=Araneus ventricosus TaxID=182803 RepID=A0A4Y2S135_ARAVE|nr:hypothetical protein AVEN_148969-1 [Araneus ventricosus]